MKRLSLLFTLLVAISVLLAACLSPAGGGPSATPKPATAEAAAPSNPALILATTTSTQDSGLLDVLVPICKSGRMVCIHVLKQCSCVVQF